MTWRRLISEMDARELTYWMAFFRREQRDQERSRQQAKDNAVAQDMARGLARGYRG